MSTETPAYSVPDWIRFADFRSRVNHVAAFTGQPHPSGFAALVVIDGPRRCGKSRLARFLVDRWSRNNLIMPNSFPINYVGFQALLTGRRNYPLWIDFYKPTEWEGGPHSSLVHEFLTRHRSNPESNFILFSGESIKLPPQLEGLTRRIHLAEPESPF